MHPRVLLLSQRGISDQVANACLYDFEDLVCDLDQVDLFAPTAPHIHPGRMYKLGRLLRAPKTLSQSVAFAKHEFEPKHDYDVLFVVLDNYRQVTSLHSIKAWRQRCHKVICFFPEIYPKDYLHHNAILELFEDFDHIFIGVQHGIEKLAKIIGKPCSNLHPGVNALQFYPNLATPRGIDVCYIGRRSGITHRALSDLASAKDLFYYYDTAKGGFRVGDHVAHRRLYANLVRRSRYFIVNYGKIDQPDKTGGAQEAGYRFFEGVAGGAVMIGKPPDTAVFRRLFDWPDAVVEAPFDAPEIGALIAELDADEKRVARIRRDNVVNALRRHDWVYRYREMLAAVGLEPSPNMVAREEALEDLARSIENGRNGEDCIDRSRTEDHWATQGASAEADGASGRTSVPTSTVPPAATTSSPS